MPKKKSTRRIPREKKMKKLIAVLGGTKVKVGDRVALMFKLARDKGGKLEYFEFEYMGGEPRRSSERPRRRPRRLCIRMNARLIINGMEEATITKIGINTCTVQKGKVGGLSFEIDNRSVESCKMLGETRARDFEIAGFDQHIYMREDRIEIGCTQISEPVAQTLFEAVGEWLGYEVEK